MPITARTHYRYYSDNYEFQADHDEFRTMFTISCVLYEVIKRTSGKYIAMNVFGYKVFKNIPGIHFDYYKIQYILSLLANEHVKDDLSGKVIQKGLIRIEQQDTTNEKRIVLNGELGDKRLAERVEDIMNLSIEQLDRYSKYGAHRENKKAFKTFAEWKSKLDKTKGWMKWMHKILPNMR